MIRSGVTVLVGLLVLSAVPAAADPSPLVTAHRGGAAYAPENTMLAVRNAVRLDVDAVEVDVMPTADGDLVVIHDDTLDRTTDCTGAVVDRTVAQLAGCDAAYWFTPGQATTRPDPDGPHPLRGAGITIPTLAELFGYALSLGDAAPELVVELKNIPGEAGFDPTGTRDAARFVELVHDFDLTDRVVVQSFWPETLEAVRSIDPAIRTLFLTTSSVGVTASANLAYVVSRGHDIAAPNHDAPDFGPDFVTLAHRAGKQVYTWTVNDPGDMERVAATGADAIMSDYPACLLAALGRPVPKQVSPAELRRAGTAVGPCPGEWR
jgi:glycerophosphoryl diester phosphodiesterase